MSKHKKVKKRRAKNKILIILCVMAAVLGIYKYLTRSYSAEDFGIETVYSSVDFNGNGVDDYTDILLGARKDARKRPKYNDAYYQGGYPPDNIGVCTDVVWRAFKNAGYSVKDMLDFDISRRKSGYPIISEPDPNIDFRRVGNLHSFFKKYAISLTTDITDISEWQPGDVVVFKNDKHVGIVSDKRNKDGITYIIHNGGQFFREEDYLPTAVVTGHYRFDASRINNSVLKQWHD